MSVSRENVSVSEEKIPPPSSRQTFVEKLLKTYSGLNDETVALLTDGTGFPLFKMAFVSETVSPDANYEQLEFIGDTLMNDSVALFILNKFPTYTVSWLTYIKHSVISSRGLSQLAEFLGFWENEGSFIEYQGDKEHAKKKLLEDVLEAFVGTLRQIVDSKATVLCGENPPFGLGTVIAQKFIFSALEAMVKAHPHFISDSWERVKDPKTRIKELMTKYRLGKISKNLSTRETREMGQIKWIATLFLCQSGTAIRWHTFRGTSSSSKQDAEQQVARQALSFLLHNKNYFETIPPKTIGAKRPSAPSPSIPR